MKAAFALAATAALLAVAGRASAGVLDRDVAVGRATSVRLNVSGNVHVSIAPSGARIGIHVVDYGPKTPAMHLATSKTGSRLTLSITGPSENILPFVGATGYTVDVTIPRDLKFDLREFAGRVRIDRVTAPMQVYNANGTIDVSDAQSALTAESDLGDITVHRASDMLELTCGTGNVTATLADGWHANLVRIEASQGNVALHVPPRFRARYDVTSGSGQVHNPMHSVPHAPLVFMLTENGDASIDPR